MFTRQKHNFAIVFELIQITDVLPVNPYAGGLRGFGGGNEAELPHNLALCEGHSIEKEKGKKKRETRCLESIRPNHVQSPYWLGDCGLCDCRTNRQILQHPIACRSPSAALGIDAGRRYKSQRSHMPAQPSAALRVKRSALHLSRLTGGGGLEWRVAMRPSPRADGQGRARRSRAPSRPA